MDSLIFLRLKVTITAFVLHNSENIAETKKQTRIRLYRRFRQPMSNNVTSPLWSGVLGLNWFASRCLNWRRAESKMAEDFFKDCRSAGLFFRDDSSFTCLESTHSSSSSRDSFASSSADPLNRINDAHDSSLVDSPDLKSSWFNQS